MVREIPFDLWLNPGIILGRAGRRGGDGLNPGGFGSHHKGILMFRDIAIIVAARIQTLRNSLRDRSSRKKALFLFALAGGFLLLTYFGSYWLFGYFRGVRMEEQIPGMEMIGDLLNRMMLSLIFLVFLSVLIFSNLVTGLSSYFIAEDLELLNSAPVNRESLFLTRFLEGLLESSWMLFIFGLPILFAFGAEYGLAAGYYLMVIGVLFFFILTPAALANIIILLLVNSFPARRLRDLLLLLSIIAAAIIVVMLRLIQPERLVNPEAQETVFEFLLTLRQPMSLWLPSYWASEALYRFSREGWAGAKIFFGLLASTGMFSLFLSYGLWHWLYDEGYSKTQEASRATITRSAAVQGLLDFLSSPFHPSLKQILLKEVKSFIRDASQWSQLFLLAALMIIYIFNFRVLPLDQIPFDQFSLKNAVCFLNMGLAGFVLAALSARFVFPMTSLEGRNFWIIKSAPISLSRFIWSKFWLAWPCLGIIAEALILITNHYLRVSPLVWWVSSVTIFLLSFAVVGMALGFGALFPRFFVENPAKIAVGFGGAVYMISAMLMIFLVVVIEAYPTFLFFVAQHNDMPLPPWTWPAAIGAGVLVLLFSVFGLLLPVRAGIRYLENMEF
jgi:ABC-2 type transport system permease protein